MMVFEQESYVIVMITRWAGQREEGSLCRLSSVECQN